MKKILAFAAVLLIASASVFAGGAKEEKEKYSPGPDGKYSIVGSYVRSAGGTTLTFDETNFSTVFIDTGFINSGTYELSDVEYFTGILGIYEKGIIIFYTDEGITKMEYELTNKFLGIYHPGLTKDFVWGTGTPPRGKKYSIGRFDLVSD